MAVRWMVGDVLKVFPKGLGRHGHGPGVLGVLLIGLVFGACSKPLTTDSGCEGANACDPGQVCVESKCLQVCGDDAGCNSGQICEGDVCIDGVRANIPDITAIRGNGSTDNNFRDALIIEGTYFEGVTVELLGTTDHALALRSSSPTQLEALLPTDLAEDSYFLKVTNAAGFDQNEVQILQGEKGDPRTGPEILTLLADIDGAGSGLDADRLDGLDSTAFVQHGDGWEFVDGALGLGTESPQARLDIQGNSASYQPLDLAGATLTNSGLGSFNAGPLVDGDVDTIGWDTDTSVPGAYVQVDFGSAQEVVWLSLSCNFGGSAYPTGRYDFMFSDDESTWEQAVTNVNPAPDATVAYRWESVGAHRYWRLVLLSEPGDQAEITELAMGIPAAGTALRVDDSGRVAIGKDVAQATLDVNGTIAHKGLIGRVCPDNHYLAMGYCLPKGELVEKTACTNGTLHRGICYSWPTSGGQCQQMDADAAETLCTGLSGRLCAVAELDRLDSSGCGGDGTFSWAVLSPDPTRVDAARGRCIRTNRPLLEGGALIRPETVGKDDIAECYPSAYAGSQVAPADTAYGVCCFD